MSEEQTNYEGVQDDTALDGLLKKLDKPKPVKKVAKKRGRPKKNPFSKESISKVKDGCMTEDEIQRVTGLTRYFMGDIRKQMPKNSYFSEGNIRYYDKTAINFVAKAIGVPSSDILSGVSRETFYARVILVPRNIKILMCEYDDKPLRVRIIDNRKFMPGMIVAVRDISGDVGYFNGKLPRYKGKY